MNPDLKRKLVSVEQLHTLLEFMREHPELARGLNRGGRGRLMTVKVWNACAKKLNSMKNGAVKDGKGWSKYWCDWKYRVRRHALEIKAARDANKVLPEGLTALSPFEETIMNIIGDSSIDGVVIKSDPLGEEDPIEEDTVETADDSVKHSQYYATRSKTVKRRRSSTADVSSRYDDDHGADDEAPDSPPEQKTRVADESECKSNKEDSTAQFLRLEKMHLDNAKKMQKSICLISLEICKLTDIMGEIRDVLVKRLDNNIT